MVGMKDGWDEGWEESWDEGSDVGMKVWKGYGGWDGMKVGVV